MNLIEPKFELHVFRGTKVRNLNMNSFICAFLSLFETSHPEEFQCGVHE